MADVFISYSRHNSEFARRIIDKLILHGKDFWVDWEGIPLSSPNWWMEIKTGIEAADNFVFIMSPDSMASVVCNMEVDYAIELRKRIIPIVYQDVETEKAFASVADFKPDAAMQERLAGKKVLAIARANWQRLSHINWMFFRSTDDFDRSFEILFNTLETDLDYVRSHTRYLTRAQEWSRENQREDLLLFGGEIDRAETWFKQGDAYAAVETNDKVDVVNPLPQELHRTYVQASRTAEIARARSLRNIRRARFIGISLAVIALIFAIGASLVGLQATTNANEASIRESAANIQVANANKELTAVPPTLTQVNQQVVAAQGQANAAGTQVVVANDALTAVPPTLTQVNQQVVAAQDQANAAGTQVVVANDALTAVPPTLTQVNQQVVAAQGQADAAGTQVVVANGALTAVVPTLTQINQQVVVAQGQADAAGTQVVVANGALTAVVPTLTQVAALVQEGEARIVSLNLASEAIDILSASDGNAEVAALLSIRALNEGYTPQADAALVTAINRLPSRQIFGTTNGIRIYAVALTPNNGQAITGGEDKKIRIWNMQTGLLEKTLDARTSVESLAISPDGRYVLSGNRDNAARLWDIANGELIATLHMNEGYVTSVAFSPNGKQFATADTNGNVIIWDVETQDLLVTITHEMDSDNQVEVFFSPDSRFVATASSSSIALWNSTTGTLIDSFRPRSLLTASFSSNNSDIKYISSGGRTGLIEMTDGTELQNPGPQVGSVMSGAFSPDGSIYATGDLEGNIHVYSTQDRLLIKTLTGHGSTILTDAAIEDLVFSNDGQYILSGSQDGTARLWSVGNNNPNEFLQMENGLGTFDVSHDGRFLAYANVSDTFSLIDITTKRSLYSIKTSTSDYGAVQEIVFSPDDRYIAIATTNAEEFDVSLFTASLYETKTGKLLHTFKGQTTPVSIIDFSNDSQYMLTASSIFYNTQPSDTNIRVWDTSTGESAAVIEMNDNVYDAAFLPDGTHIVTDNGRIIRVWDIATHKVMKEYPFLVADFSENGQYTIVANDDFTFSLIENASGNETMRFIGHTADVGVARISDDLKYLITSGKDNTFRLWNVEDGRELLNVAPSNIYGLDLFEFLPPNNTYFFAGKYQSERNLGLIYLRPLNYKDLITTACKYVFRDFNDEERIRYSINDDEPTCPQFAAAAPSG